MVEILRIRVNTPNLKDIVYMTEQANLVIKAMQNFNLKPLGTFMNSNTPKFGNLR